MIFIQSLISSLVEVSITQPLDVIKIHYQNSTYQNSTQINYTFRNLYKGFVPRSIGNIPSRTIFLYSQDIFTSKLIHNPYKNYIVPILSGFCQTLVDTPVEVLKINRITNQNEKFLFKGFIPHCSRNIIFLGFVYNFRQRFYSDSIINNTLYGSLGGVIGSNISHPLDTIKTRIQSNKPYKNLLFKELMKGSHLRASISMINMIISLSVFETLQYYKILDSIL